MVYTALYCPPPPAAVHERPFFFFLCFCINHSTLDNSKCAVTLGLQPFWLRQWSGFKRRCRLGHWSASFKRCCYWAVGKALRVERCFSIDRGHCLPAKDSVLWCAVRGCFQANKGVSNLRSKPLWQKYHHFFFFFLLDHNVIWKTFFHGRF